MIGARMTLVGAGIGGAVITFAALFLPGMRDVEREEPAGEPEEAPATFAVDVVRGRYRGGTRRRRVAAGTRMHP